MRLVLLLGLAACVTTNSPDTTLASNRIGVTVDRIADGDSFRAGELEVRLVGVNAPELNECYGDESRDWLQNEIADRMVELVIVDIDQFDRSLAEVYFENRWINEELAASGHALALSSSATELLDGEGEARIEGRGMWATGICGANDPIAHVSIVNVVFNPPGEDTNEQVTIRNSEERAIDLSGFVLRDESSVNRFDLTGRTLPAGAETVIVTSSVWNNDGDTALLLDASGRIVSVYRYP
ncbi:MAG: lamin tail domain-containing protein [Acidimicrobiia bacterium]